MGTRPTCHPLATVPAYWQARCHLTVLLLNSSAALKSRLSLYLGGNSFGTILSNQGVAGNDLCHYRDRKAEVNRVTHYAFRVRRSALTISPYLWPPAPVQCSSASRCVPLSFDPALAAFPGAELNFSRPVAGDTKTREFKKFAT